MFYKKNPALKNGITHPCEGLNALIFIFFHPPADW